MERVEADPMLQVETGTWFTLVLDDADMKDVTRAGVVDRLAVERLVDSAMLDVRAIGWPPEDGTYPMGPLGSFRVRRGAGPEPKLSFDAEAIERDQDHEGLRLHDDLQEAAAQLACMKGHPGLVVLDAGRDGLLVGRHSNMADLLAAESWAQNLAGVLVLDRFSTEGLPDCIAHFVPGRLSDAASELLAGLPGCPAGHVHARSGVFPVPPCPHQKRLVG